MAEYVVLDTAIIDWVLICFSVLIVLTGILRYLVSKLNRSSPTCDAKMIKDGQVVIRARNLNIGANFIPPPKSFPARRFYFSNEENGLLHVLKDQAAQNPQAQMFSDPNIAMDMMKKNLLMIIPLTLTVDVSSRSRSVSSYTDTHLPEMILTEILARQVVIRARNLNVGTNFIPPKSFRARRFYFSNEANGLLHVPKDQAQNPQAKMFSDPNMAMDMMKKNLSMIIPLTLTVDVSSRESSYTDTHLPEATLTEILARLPLRSIFRFKSVCRRWKSTLESVYFRHLFLSLHQNTSSCWSLLLPGTELIDFHGCQTWGLPKSLGSYILNIEVSGKFSYVGSSNGLVLMNGYDGVSYVGNPVLQQWVEIPSPPCAYVTLLSGLVTRVDDDFVVLSFKVVRTAATTPSQDRSSTCLCYWVYSSETGIWTRKRLHCPHYFTCIDPPMSMHGTLYLPSSGFDDLTVPGALIVHDFYGESNLCRAVPLPDYNSNHNRDFKRALTRSTGFVMYIKALPHNVLKVWRLLNNDDDLAWQLEWEIRLPFDDISNYAPLAMHPFDRHIVYLWSQQNRCLVSYNLHTQNYKIFGEDQSVDDDLQNCFVNQSICEKHMDSIFGPYSYPEYNISITAFPAVLPRWMESMPRPPQVEMVDTTSLLSYIASKS